MTKDDYAEDTETVISFRREVMINEDVKAAEQNMAGLINNLVRQIEGDTGMSVRVITVDRWKQNADFKVSMSLEVKK